MSPGAGAGALRAPRREERGQAVGPAWSAYALVGRSTRPGSRYGRATDAISSPTARVTERVEDLPTHVLGSAAEAAAAATAGIAGLSRDGKG